MNAADLAQRQLDAYNAHDLEAFAACYAEEVEVFALPSGDLMFAGREALIARYGPYFEAQRPQAELTERLTLGAMALDVEAVRLADGSGLAAWALYHVEGGLIRRVWFMRG